ncbi:hypothetical protein ACE1TF_12150 [Geomicrobium sp. JSM 1781026]|uniref:hypothetical protein n=1 Tax=Geomicrobium sp. JSM 1781026 TaxID=3344580 RepID=UPI0035BEB8FB
MGIESALQLDQTARKFIGMNANIAKLGKLERKIALSTAPTTNSANQENLKSILYSKPFLESVVAVNL